MKRPPETVFLDDPQLGVKVTNARLIVPSETYAMAGVVSVKSFTRPPDFSQAISASVISLIVFTVVAVIITAASGQQFFPCSLLGTLFLAVIGSVLIGFLMAHGQKTTHFDLLRNAGGEVRAFGHKDKAVINRIVQAVADAIVHRGVNKRPVRLGPAAEFRKGAQIQPDSAGTPSNPACVTSLSGCGQSVCSRPLKRRPLAEGGSELAARRSCPLDKKDIRRECE